MTRREDWPSRLAAAIEAARAKPFDVATHNCGTFAADCIEAMTGERVHDAFAPRHASRRAYVSACKRLRSLVSEVLGVDATNARLARRGDVVLASADDAEWLGVCVGHKLASVGEAGLVFLPMGAALCAWPV